MNMKNVILIVTIFLFSACEPVKLSGDLMVNKKITLKSKGQWGKTSNITIPSGIYKWSELTLNNGAIDLSVTLQRKVTNISIKGPRLNIPKKSGKFNISKTKIGQDYDMHGAINYSENSSGDVEYSYDSCTVSQYRSICDARCGDRGCCRLEIDVPGIKKTAYEKIHYNRNITIDFVKGKSKHATFKGSGKGSRKRFLHTVEDCRANGSF